MADAGLIYVMSLSPTELFGRLHPLLVHFPIALLLLAAAFEFWRLKWNSATSASCSRLVVILGAIAAVVAAVTGWVFSQEHHRTDTAALLAQHRWLGIATAVMAVASALAIWRWNESTVRSLAWLRRGIVWTAAILLTVAAHLGAMLVWGDDYFTY